MSYSACQIGPIVSYWFQLRIAHTVPHHNMDLPAIGAERGALQLNRTNSSDATMYYTM
jgi:hypothetical protein